MKYPMQHKGEGGWTFEVKFLKRIQDVIRTRGFGGLSLEQIEEVLLAVENLSSAEQSVEPDGEDAAG